MNIVDSKLKKSIIVILLCSILITILILIKSTIDFSRSGPEIKSEIIDHYKIYVVYSMARLSFYTFLICIFLTSIGVSFYNSFIYLLNSKFRWLYASFFAFTSFGIISTLFFLHKLLYQPSTIVASFVYRISRLYPLWDLLSPARLFVINLLVVFIFLAVIGAAFYKKFRARGFLNFKFKYILLLMIGGTAFFGFSYLTDHAPVVAASNQDDRPNIVMIGSDTLRMDRLGVSQYSRNLTPNIDLLSKDGAVFGNCYVSLARTAPSLVSFLTGTWIHKHGFRDNYIGDSDLNIPVPTLPQVLKKAGYRSAVVADWAGGDFGKLNFGFDDIDTAPDQWNIKYLIRQGPKDIRLFLSLFVNNKLGKFLLPEIYYIAGTPLNKGLLSDVRENLFEFSRRDEPFFMTIFSAATHMPFSPEYPYYLLYADPAYRGESKFSMAGLSTPEEVIDKQSKGKEHFDYQQIVDLYDGSVKSFDDFVGNVVAQLKEFGFSENTIVVIFSDHGTELFESDMWGQGNSVSGDDYSLRVPLVIYDPRRPKVGQINKTTRSIDLMPTLLDLASLPIPDSVDGISLKPYFENPQLDLELLAFAETGIWLSRVPGIKDRHLTYPDILKVIEIKNKETGTLSVKSEYEDLVVKAKDRMVRNDRWKLVYMPMIDGAHFYLFDMVNDKECKNDVSKKYPDIFNKLKVAMIAWLESEPDWVYQDGYVVRAPVDSKTFTINGNSLGNGM